MILELDNVQAYYGKSHILNGVSLGVEEGTSVCLLGRNGVGKSTTIKTIMGKSFLFFIRICLVVIRTCWSNLEHNSILRSC